MASHLGMDQYLLIPFLVGWTSINPSYFDVNYRGTIGFDTLPFPNMPNCFFHLFSGLTHGFSSPCEGIPNPPPTDWRPQLWALWSSWPAAQRKGGDPSIHWSITMFPIEIAIFIGVFFPPDEKTHQSRKQKSAAGIGWKAGIKYRSK